MTFKELAAALIDPDAITLCVRGHHIKVVPIVLERTGVDPMHKLLGCIQMTLQIPARANGGAADKIELEEMTR